MRPIPLALALLLAAGPAAAQQGTSLPALQRGPEAQALREIEATRQLPAGSFSAIKIKGRQGLYFLSSDGRILIKGSAYDLWSGRNLTTLDDIERAATRIDLKGFAAIWPQLDPLTLGRGPGTVVAFVSPGCPLCRSLIDQAQSLTDRYRFLLLPIPAGGDSAALVRGLACAEDRKAAEAAYLHHTFTATAQKPVCDLEALQRRVITAQLLGIKAVPWIVRPDGVLSPGMPPDLAAWLAAGARS